MRSFSSTTFAKIGLSVSFALAVAGTALAQTGRPVIGGSTNALGAVGQDFSFGIVASGSPTNYGASNLPPGLFPPVAGSANITGLPQVAGTFTSTMTAVNSNGTAATNLFINITPPPAPVVATPATVFGIQDQALRVPLVSTPNHSNVPTTFSVSGLPPSVNLITTVTANATYPSILVTNYFLDSPSLLTNGSFTIPIVARNNGGTQSSTSNLTLVINPTNLPVFTTNSANVTGLIGVPFSYDVTALNSPLRFRVTSIVVSNSASSTTTPVNITNGPLVNGLSFANVTVGNSMVGRVSGTPGVSNTVTLFIEARNNSGPSTNLFQLSISNQPSQPTVIMSQPLGEGNYVIGSSFFLNAQVFNRPDNLLVPSSFAFRESNNAIAGTVGVLGDYFGLEYSPTTAVGAAAQITAFALNAVGGSNLSQAFDMTGQVARAPLPTIEMLPLNAGQSLAAGGKVVLSARATIPSTAVRIDRVEFYVNKVYAGSALAPQPDTEGVYEFQWTSPSTPGSFQITARAVSLNFTAGFPDVLPPGTPVWASVIAQRPIVVNTQRGSAPAVAITFPSDNGVLNLGVNNRIQASATLVGGSIRSVEFFANGQRIPSNALAGGTPNPDLRAPFEVDFSPGSAGLYEIYAIATGSNGLQTVSPVVRANVATGRPPTVRITAPEKRELTMPQAPLTLLWTSIDQDGSITGTELFVNGASVRRSTQGSDNFTYTFPSQGRFVFVARATDNSGNVAESDPVVVAVDNSFVDPSPVVSLDSRTFAEQGYVVGSQLYFNASATASGTNAILTNDFSFNLGSTVRLPATKTVLTQGGTPIYSSEIYTLRAGSPGTIVARATDSQGNVGFSDVKSFYFANPFSPLPSVSVVTAPPITPPVAGDVLELRAAAIFPVGQFSTTANARVEFYGNGVLLGAATPASSTNVTTGVNAYTHTFPWLIPTNASGDFRITARAVQLNFNSPNVDENGNVVSVTPYYSSVISPNSTTIRVESIPSELPVGSNGAFVLDMFRKLLYQTTPNYNDWADYTSALDSGAMDRATVVMTMMGFDQTRKVFNRDNVYGRTSGTAMLPFARLGISPTETQVRGFLSALEVDSTLLPITDDYSGIPDAPWNATYGMARGMQQIVIASTAFRRAYPTVTGLANTPFNDWMRSKMFKNVSGGDESKIIEMMNTIVPQSIKQGAAMAFRSELAWVSLDAGYEIQPEQNLQLQAGTAMLSFQLNGTWSLTKLTPFYSKQVVENILASGGYISFPAALAKAQTISFRPPSKIYAGRTYRLTARSTSTLPVTLAVQDPSGAASVVASGPNTVTLKVNKSGSIGVTAVQPGGATKAGKAFLPATPVQTSIIAVQK